MPTERDGEGTACHLLLGAQVQQVLADLLFRDLVRGDMIELGKLGDGADAGLDGTIRIAAELEVMPTRVWWSSQGRRVVYGSRRRSVWKKSS